MVQNSSRHGGWLVNLREIRAECVSFLMNFNGSLIWSIQFGKETLF